MTRLSGYAVLGALTLSWAGQSFAEQPRTGSGGSKEGQVSSEWNTDIRPPLVPGEPRDCAHPPDRADILRALPPMTGGHLWFDKQSRDNGEFTVECLVDRVDPPRFYPLVGPAQLHHCHYKCTVSYTESFVSGNLFNCQFWQHRRTETVYIDRDHLHLVDVTSAATK